ncbi:interferon-inducible GTPase 1-like [Dendronephthya gigantea]|uniref:interferon-inducible GTPase 1-like n=1 Tax=Dendronephthya gigantea TaxID=151771 RepID=UPI00106B14E9|nr:interferon-inducible GTPase 1-like [Dendronephthya gigantea]
MGEVNFRQEDINEVQEHVERNGVLNIGTMLNQKLEENRNTEINIGITGNSGTGKSSFINAIRGVPDDDPTAAPTGVTQTTIEPTPYHNLENYRNIIFWDLPGIGTVDFPNLKTYKGQVHLGDYDVFLILAASRFTLKDLELAREIRSMHKKFFFVYTKIDVDTNAEKRKQNFDETQMLESIRNTCLNSLMSLQDHGEDAPPLFLISNHYPEKWEFSDLTNAILDALPKLKQEALTLFIDVLISKSADILKRKIKVLKERIWMVALNAGVAGLVPIPGFSTAVNFVLIRKEIKFYRSQLGLPEDGTDEFAKMNPAYKGTLTKFSFSTPIQFAQLVTSCMPLVAGEKLLLVIPVVGIVLSSIAGGAVSSGLAYYILKKCLEEFEKIALDEINKNSIEDSDNE